MDLGRTCVDRPTARQVIAEYQARQRVLADHALEQAKHQRAEQERLEAEYIAANKVRQLRAERQRELLSATPDLTALELMLAADDPDPNNRRTPASIAFDEIIATNNRGDVGVFYKLSPVKD